MQHCEQSSHMEVSIKRQHAHSNNRQYTEPRYFQRAQEILQNLEQENQSRATQHNVINPKCNNTDVV